MHTRESDGRATLEEMAEAARALGYEYIAITDHSKALAMANGLDEKRAVAFAHQVREMDQSGLGLRVFSGLECDIRRDGAMDLEDDALGELDLVIGSVHSYMNLEAGGDDRPAAARARMSASARARPSHRPHAAASRSVSVRLRSRGRGGGAPQRVSGNQRQPGAAGSDGLADSRGQGQGLQVRRSRPTRIIPSIWPTCATACRMARRGWLEPADILNTLPVGEFAQGHSR